MSLHTPDRSRRNGAPDVRPTGRSDPYRPTPPPRPPGTPRSRAPLVVAAGVAAAWAALVSCLPAVVVLGLAPLGEDAGTLTSGLRLGLAGWLLGHGVPLHTSVGTLGLVPLTLTALATWRLVRAGVHATRAVGGRRSESTRQALLVAGTVGIWYGLLGALAGWLVAAGGSLVSPVRSGVTLAVFGAGAALVGSLHTTRVLWVLSRRLPPVVRDALRTALVATVLLLAGGSGAAGLAVATGGGEASDMIGAYRTGPGGQAGITMVSAAYAPNAAIWATAYLLGPGFAVGTDTTVRITEVTLGALPAVPLLAGVPDGPLGGVGAGLLAVPLLAGMAAGWLLVRRRRETAGGDQPAPGWAHLVGAVVLAGVVTGVLVGVAAFVSGGPLGGGRLAQIGPVPWQTAVVSALVVVVGAATGVASARVFARPSTGRSGGSPAGPRPRRAEGRPTSGAGRPGVPEIDQSVERF